MKSVLAGDLGGTNFRAAVVDAGGRVHRIVSARIPAVATPRRVLSVMTGLFRQAGDGARPAAFTLSMKGLVDPARGLSNKVSDFRSWRNVPVVSELRRSLRLPGFLENDAKCAALGEGWVGRARGVRDYVFVIVGTGIGTGIVQGGKLSRGAHGHAGEMGHTVIDACSRDFRCACGQTGDLECLAAGPTIGLRARRLLARGDKGLKAFARRRPGPVDGLWVSAALKAKVPTARSILRETGTWLGLGLYNLTRALDPELIVLGGGAASIGGPLIGPARRECARRLALFHLKPPRILASALGDRAGLLGAASLYFVPSSRLREEG